MLAQRDQRIRYPKAMFYTNPKILKSLKLKRMASRLTLGYGFLKKKKEKEKGDFAPPDNCYLIGHDIRLARELNSTSPLTV